MAVGRLSVCLFIEQTFSSCEFSIFSYIADKWTNRQSQLHCLLSTGAFSVTPPDPTQSADYKQHTNPTRSNQHITPKLDFQNTV